MIWKGHCLKKIKLLFNKKKMLQTFFWINLIQKNLKYNHFAITHKTELF